jgi:hypothetical protein
MAEIYCDDNTLIVDIQGLHKVWAVKNRLEIPLANVERITHDPSVAMPGWLAMKFPATNIPRRGRMGLLGCPRPASGRRH